MTKSEFVAKVAAEAGVNHKDAARVLDAIGKTAVAVVATGDTVDIPGVGKLGRAHRSERQARNLATGETMTVPAKHVPTFKAGKAFKDAVAAA